MPWSLIGPLCLIILAAGGAPHDPSRQLPPSPSPFRSDAVVVEVAVLARDQAGRPVTDLRPAELTVAEGHAAQEIVAFERISVPQFRAVAGGAAVVAAPVRDVSSNETLGAARVFILVLDALHVAPDRNLAVRRYARQFLEQQVGPGDLAAVISPGGPSSATEDFTSDKARLLAAVDNFVGTKLRSATVERYEEKNRFYDGIAMHGGKDPDDGERANRAASLTSTLEAIARHVDRIEGRRKALLLFSEGIEYDTSDMLGDAQRYASEVTHAMERATGALMRTNVAMYTIDPRLLSTAQGDMIETPIYEHPGSPGDLSEHGIEAEFAASIRSLRDLAQATGGFLASDKGLGRAFDQIAQETSEYYVLGYTPAKPAKPGESRTITVTTSRPGVTLTARKGYVMLPPPQRQAAVDAGSPEVIPSMARPGRRPSMSSSLPAATATAGPTPGVPEQLAWLLASPLPKAGLPLRVQAIPFSGSDKKAVVQLIVEVLGGGLQFDERGGRSEERIEVALLTVDDRGRSANGRSTTIDLRLPPDELARVRTTGVRWLSKLELAPGRYQVRVAARAARTGVSGLVTHVIEVPAFGREKLSLSGVTLTSLPSVLMPTRGRAWLETSLGLPPSAARTFVAGDQLTAAVEVYAPESGRAEADVVAELESSGAKTTRPVAKSRNGDRARSREIAFQLDTSSLPRGHYVLRITATLPGTNERLERRVPFDVV
ncbi:MAG: VWA domain-containing protein [Acidobacteriota bacterium]